MAPWTIRLSPYDGGAGFQDEDGLADPAGPIEAVVDGLHVTFGASHFGPPVDVNVDLDDLGALGREISVRLGLDVLAIEAGGESEALIRPGTSLLLWALARLQADEARVRRREHRDEALHIFDVERLIVEKCFAALSPGGPRRWAGSLPEPAQLWRAVADLRSATVRPTDSAVLASAIVGATNERSERPSTRETMGLRIEREGTGLRIDVQEPWHDVRIVRCWSHDRLVGCARVEADDESLFLPLAFGVSLDLSDVGSLDVDVPEPAWSDARGTRDGYRMVRLNGGAAIETSDERLGPWEAVALDLLAAGNISAPEVAFRRGAEAAVKDRSEGDAEAASRAARMHALADAHLLAQRSDGFEGDVDIPAGIGWMWQAHRDLVLTETVGEFYRGLVRDEPPDTTNPLAGDEFDVDREGPHHAGGSQ